MQQKIIPVIGDFMSEIISNSDHAFSKNIPNGMLGSGIFEQHYGQKRI
jgi:hypothetical protein